jgi:hypothetical protein
MDELVHTLKTYIDTFREPYMDEETTNEDILKLEENINKIKKRRKNATNYSNMETLDNIYENSSTKAEKGSDGVTSYKDEIFLENFQDNNSEEETSKTQTESFKSKKGKKGKKGKKNRFAKFTEKMGNFFNKIKKYIDSANNTFFYGYKQFDKLISYIAFSYVHFISTSTMPELNNLNFNLSNATKHQSQHIHSDADNIKHIVYSIFLLPLCLYSTYNWFYLLVYLRPKENSDGEYERPFDDDIRMKISLDGIKPDFIKTPLESLFKYTITPLYWIDQLFNNSKYTSFAVNYIGWNIINYFILFVAVLFINKKFGLFESLEHIIKNKSSFLYKFCAGFIISALIYNIFNHIFNPSEENKLIRVFKYLFGLLIAFAYIIFNTFIAGMSINVSAIIILIYLWIHSLFGMVLYNKNGISGIFEQMANITSYIKKDYDKIKAEECEEFTIFQKMIHKIIAFLNDYRLLITVAIVIILDMVSTTFYYTSVRIATIVISVILLLITYSILSYRKGNTTSTFEK